MVRLVPNHPARAAVAAIAVGLLAACSGGGSSSTTSSSSGGSSSSSSASTTTSTTTTAPTTTTASTTTAPPTTPPTTAPPATTAPPLSGHCHTSELTGSVGPSQGAAGNIYTPVVVTNTGGRTCAIYGYPGMSVLDAQGGAIGSAADREPGPVSSVTLAPGAQASTLIHTQNEGFSDIPCRPTSSSLLMYPPDEFDAMVIPAQIRICGEMFLVRAFVPGAEGN